MSSWKELIEGQPVLEEEKRQQLQEPPKYHVMLLNDDYTPMDFVVEVLCKFFNMDSDRATEVMLAVHYKGKGLCGTYSADVAETKVELVNHFSYEHQHPLKCVMEKA